MLYKYSGQFDEAEKMYRRALRIAENRFGEHHAAVATLYHNLSGLERARQLRGGRTSGPPLCRNTPGAAHPDVAVTLNNMALLAKRRGELTIAAAIYDAL